MPESASRTLERVEVTGLPRTCGEQVTARMSVRAARCALRARAVPPLSLHQAEPGRSPGAGTRTGNPGPSGLDQNPEPGCPGGGTDLQGQRSARRQRDNDARAEKRQRRLS